MNTRNQIRNLAEVVSLEAWHEAFGPDRREADIHVNVAFATGRIGGKPADKVRFRLTLKQAEIVIVIPPGEPAKVETRSVRRDARVRGGTATETHETDRSGKVAAGAVLKAGATGIDAGLELGAQASASLSKKTVVAITETLRDLSVVHGLEEDGSHRWTITPSIGSELVGQPWRSEDEPRLKVIDTRQDRGRGLAPSIRVEVRCRREDLIISEIVLKDEVKGGLLSKKPQYRNRQVAAEAFLRNRLFEEGLLQGGEGDLTDPFARMTLAVIQAEGV